MYKIAIVGTGNVGGALATEIWPSNLFIGNHRNR